MRIKPVNILFICHDRVKVAGAALSLLNLLESIDDNDYHPILLLRKGVVKDLFTEHGYECISFPFQLSLTRNTSTIFRVVRKMIDALINYLCILYVAVRLRNRKIAIVHSNSTATDIGYYLSKKLNAKHVWHVREFLDLDFNTSPSKGWDDMYAKLGRSDYVIAITKKVYTHWHLDSYKNAVVLHDAVRSQNDVDFSDTKEKYILFCAAVLSDGKGANVAVELFCLSRLSREGYRLRIIGNYIDEYKEKLDKIAESYGEKGNIDYLGFQKDIKPHMLKATAFLMCSANEALGRVTIEAFFYGCPVLGHNTGGTAELIEDGINGYLYNDIDEAVIKLQQIISQKDHTLRLIQKAQQDAIEKFSNESYGIALARIYSALQL